MTDRVNLFSIVLSLAIDFKVEGSLQPKAQNPIREVVSGDPILMVVKQFSIENIMTTTVNFSSLELKIR